MTIIEDMNEGRRIWNKSGVSWPKTFNINNFSIIILNHLVSSIIYGVHIKYFIAKNSPCPFCSEDEKHSIILTRSWLSWVHEYGKEINLEEIYGEWDANTRKTIYKHIRFSYTNTCQFSHKISIKHFLMNIIRKS